MASDVEICNRALGLLGAQRITSLIDDSKAGRACNNNYVTSRDTVFQEHTWKECTRRAILAPLSSAPLFEWTYQYQLPTDPYCIRVLDVYNSVSSWKVEGRYLLTNDATVNIVYIGRITDPNVYSPMLKEAIALKLASDICFEITGDAKLIGLFKNEYQKTLAEARSLDSTQDGQGVTYVADEWIVNAFL